MSSRLPRQAAQPLYTCPSCTFKRSFVSSPARRRIGPESPRYVDIPEPPQQSIPSRTRLKGILPVPRDIFAGAARGRGLDKADPDNIARTTKEPTAKTTRSANDEPRTAWKQRIAEMRRSNLREGLEALRERKIRTEDHLTRRGRQRQQERHTLLHAPEREDERLTNPSVDKVLHQLMLGAPLQDPTRDARLQRMRERFVDKESSRQEEREDALHTLYMQARTFVTTEDQLNEAVDTAFGTQAEPREFSRDSNAPPSVWAYGKPEAVQQMLNRANRSRTETLLESAQGYGELTKKRVTRMAEELTGGKMDD